MRGLLGPVTIVEEQGAVFAGVEMGRACITDGRGAGCPICTQSASVCFDVRNVTA